MDHERDIVAALAQAERAGVITDVDGTISPIVDQPGAAKVTQRAKDLLAQLTQKLTLLAVVSGRAAADVQQRVGVAGLVYVGNHGLERWTENGIVTPEEVAAYRGAMEQVRDVLTAQQLDGMLIEDKIATLSIHYRNTADPQAAAEAFRPIVQAASKERGLKVFEGRMIFEVRPPLAMNKGTAFKALVEDYRLDAAVYLGDDVTDVDALNMARSLREDGACQSFAVGVESGADTPAGVRDSADVLVDGVSGVEDWLSGLLSAVSASAI